MASLDRINLLLLVVFKSCHIGNGTGVWPFLLPSTSAPLLAQSIWRFATYVAHHSCYEESLGKNLPFSMENKWRLRAMMAVYFGSGFAAPFFMVRLQLLKT
ncbi:cytochrome c oxidase subunit 7C, mitochondrial-like isoform X2 [Cricetulus griseus]|uniref:Cytochrome c oxidase subunit 7C, mitochondrial n=1 Tax=Cricetulus griseus TaxID=10029 RepID=A0A9J7KD61_CRIGR|nr:cytochrome c oxidase subunit 7C, mitochondrial-like isoform X2 [Cricetulus griseus]